jgi:hypothetical protein
MGIKRQLRGSKCKKSRGKGILGSKRFLYIGAHRNGFNDTISHEVSPNHIIITLILEGFLFSLFPSGPIPLPGSFLSLSWLAHLIGLDEDPPIFKLAN